MTVRYARPMPRTRHFHGDNSVAAFIAHMTAVQAAVAGQTERGLERAAKLLANDVRQQIGRYQPPVGPHPGWAPLSPAYEAKKVAAGFKANAPLLRTGEMRDSVGYRVNGNEAVVGAKDEKAVFHEFGTSEMPPRPMFGPAVFRNRRAIEQILGDAVLDGILGGEQADAGGYFG